MGAMKPDYQADLVFAHEDFLHAVDQIAERVRKEVVIPVCTKYKLTYTGNGVLFSELNPPEDDEPRDFRSMGDVEAYGRNYDLSEAFEILNLEVSPNDCLGFYVHDVTPDLK